MLTFIVEGKPVAWAAHQGYGKRSFSPRAKEKEYFRWQIKHQYNRIDPLRVPVRLYLNFHVPIPGGTSKARRTQMLNGLIHPTTRPDLSNYTKFTEDCLNGIVIEDDNQVVEIVSKKLFSETPKTIIKVEPIAWKDPIISSESV